MASTINKQRAEYWEKLLQRKADHGEYDQFHKNECSRCTSNKGMGFTLKEKRFRYLHRGNYCSICHSLFAKTKPKKRKDTTKPKAKVKTKKKPKKSKN